MPFDRRDAAVFLISAAILYLELVLIRWLGTEVRVFAYLGNLVLVVCFFGAGLGCYRAAHEVSLRWLGADLEPRRRADRESLAPAVPRPRSG